MLTYPVIDPVILPIYGPLSIRWYGMLYLCGFIAGWWLGRQRARHQPQRGWSEQQVGDVLFYIVLGIIVGGRVGYMLFYQFDTLLHQPWSVLSIWQGGMSFHGGLLGVILALAYFSYRHHKHFLSVADFIAPLVPPGLAFGRLANFINAELWGRETTVPWAMVFPTDPDGLARHPSQLYQFFGEGLLLFILLYWFSQKPRPRMAVAALFLMGYALLRMAAELFRQPDGHIGFLFADQITLGMLLSLPMLVMGVGLWLLAYRRRQYDWGPLKAPSVAKRPQSRGSKR